MADKKSHFLILNKEENTPRLKTSFSNLGLVLAITLYAQSMLIIALFSTFLPNYFYVAIIICILIQFSIVISLGKVIPRMSRNIITSANPNANFIKFILVDEISKKRFADFTEAIRNKWLYKTQFFQRKLTALEIIQIAEQHHIQLEEVKIHNIDLYEMVTNVSAKFHLSKPTIILTPDSEPNAGAIGAIKSSVMITSGILDRLSKPEIESVLGHEMAHIKNCDVIVLISLLSIEWFIRANFYSGMLFFFIIPYFMALMIVLAYIGKFLEARADMLSAYTINNGKLVSSFNKIKRPTSIMKKPKNYLEVLACWFDYDPHPPMYFRIQMLKNLSAKKPKFPLLVCIKKVVKATFSIKS